MTPDDERNAYRDTLEALRWLAFAERLAGAVISEEQLRSVSDGAARAALMGASMNARQILFPPDDPEDPDG